jgi:phosphohistidine swiveling domain-containing protein
MVKALIELDDATNQILNLVKAKHGFNDKGQAIEYVVRKFQDTESAPALRYINDGDKWMKAEDIPDVDFFFCQVWLSCFVNELEAVAGKGYKKILSAFNGYNMSFYYGSNDSDAVGEHLVNRFLSEPGFMAKLNKGIIETADKLRSFSDTVPERNLDTCSNAELWDFYEEHDRLHTEYYQWGWIPNAADMFHNNFTERLKKKLLEMGVSEEDVNKHLVVLTQPRDKSLIQIERIDFLKLAALVNKDDYHRKLFTELFNTFKEQDAAKYGYQTHTKEYEALLEKKAGKLITDIKQDVLMKIRGHYRKYFYVNHMWVGKAATFDYYLKELVKLLGNKSDVDATLKREEEEFQAGIRKREELMKELGMSAEWREIFDGFGDFMLTKIYRRFAQIYAAYKIEFLHKEVARRFNLTVKHIRFLLPLEVKKLLLEKRLDREELDERIKFCVYYAEEGKDVIFTGVKAKQLAEEAEKVEIKEMKELRGQVGCPGKARGVVRQIFRPDDMSKMNKGDVLVSIATDPDIVSAMKKAAAIVTEQGGVTCHAAIVSRELGIPCVIGTKIATKVLRDGDLVEVDADTGVVKIIKKA